MWEKGRPEGREKRNDIGEGQEVGVVMHGRLVGIMPNSWGSCWGAAIMV
jgi:hypothetical protein